MLHIVLPNLFTGYFEPLFVEVRKSRYREKFSVKDTLTQADALEMVDDDPDLKDNVLRALADKHDRVLLFSNNPCHAGFNFSAIREGKQSLLQGL